MKNLIKVAKMKLAITGLLVVVSITSCKKDKVEIQLQPKIVEINSISTTSLIEYMAKLINANVTDITYNESKEIFLVGGTEQISKEVLINAYKNSIK